MTVQEANNVHHNRDSPFMQKHNLNVGYVEGYGCHETNCLNQGSSSKKMMKPLTVNENLEKDIREEWDEMTDRDDIGASSVSKLESSITISKYDAVDAVTVGNLKAEEQDVNDKFNEQFDIKNQFDNFEINGDQNFEQNFGQESDPMMNSVPVLKKMAPMVSTSGTGDLQIQKQKTEQLRKPKATEVGKLTAGGMEMFNTKSNLDSNTDKFNILEERKSDEKVGTKSDEKVDNAKFTDTFTSAYDPKTNNPIWLQALHANLAGGLTQDTSDPMRFNSSNTMGQTYSAFQGYQENVNGNPPNPNRLSDLSAPETTNGGFGHGGLGLGGETQTGEFTGDDREELPLNNAPFRKHAKTVYQKNGGPGGSNRKFSMGGANVNLGDNLQSNLLGDNFSIGDSSNNRVQPAKNVDFDINKLSSQNSESQMQSEPVHSEASSVSDRRFGNLFMKFAKKQSNDKSPTKNNNHHQSINPPHFANGLARTNSIAMNQNLPPSTMNGNDFNAMKGNNHNVEMSESSSKNLLVDPFDVSSFDGPDLISQGQISPGLSPPALIKSPTKNLNIKKLNDYVYTALVLPPPLPLENAPLSVTVPAGSLPQANSHSGIVNNSQINSQINTQMQSNIVTELASATSIKSKNSLKDMFGSKEKQPAVATKEKQPAVAGKEKQPTVASKEKMQDFAKDFFSGYKTFQGLGSGSNFLAVNSNTGPAIHNFFDDVGTTNKAIGANSNSNSNTVMPHADKDDHNDFFKTLNIGKSDNFNALSGNMEDSENMPMSSLQAVLADEAAEQKDIWALDEAELWSAFNDEDDEDSINGGGGPTLGLGKTMSTMPMGGGGSGNGNSGLSMSKSNSNFPKAPKATVFKPLSLNSVSEKAALAKAEKKVQKQLKKQILNNQMIKKISENSKEDDEESEGKSKRTQIL
jgi:hypothetical protein